HYAGQLFQRAHSFKAVRIGRQLAHELLHPIGNRIADVRVQHLTVATACFVKKRGQLSQVERRALELTPDVAVQNEVGGAAQPWRWWSADAVQELHQRGVPFGDEAEPVFEILSGRGQDLVENPPLLVLEQRLKRVRGLAKM